MRKNLTPEVIKLRKDRRTRLENMNVLQEVFLELLNERKLQIADVHRATGIPFPTLQDWINKTTKSQKLDGNILALAKFFNCSIEYLAFGIGEGPNEAA